jgi:DNA-binding XRE family transcriptional regulator
MTTLPHYNRVPRMMTATAVIRAHDVRERAELTGHRVRWAREQAGITQAELGHAIGKSTGTIRNVEAGRRILTGVELVTVSRVTGVGVGWLRGGRFTVTA